MNIGEKMTKKDLQKRIEKVFIEGLKKDVEKAQNKYLYECELGLSLELEAGREKGKELQDDRGDDSGKYENPKVKGGE